MRGYVLNNLGVTNFYQFFDKSTNIEPQDSSQSN